MSERMETYYYDAVSAAGLLTSQMIWWSRSIDQREYMTNGT